MPVDHRERAFEAAIEHHLLTAGGYTKADPGNFDQERAIDPTVFLAFVKATQPGNVAGIGETSRHGHVGRHYRRLDQDA